MAAAEEPLANDTVAVQASLGKGTAMNLGGQDSGETRLIQIKRESGVGNALEVLSVSAAAHAEIEKSLGTPDVYQAQFKDRIKSIIAEATAAEEPALPIECEETPTTTCVPPCKATFQGRALSAHKAKV